MYPCQTSARLHTIAEHDAVVVVAFCCSSGAGCEPTIAAVNGIGVPGPPWHLSMMLLRCVGSPSRSFPAINASLQRPS
jgi:hypothetical protein